MALIPAVRSLVLRLLLGGVGCGLLPVRLAAEDIYCLDGTVITGVLSIKARVDALSLTTATGNVGVPFSNLPTAVRIKYGYDAFEAGYAHAQRTRPVINNLRDCFSMAQLDQAKAKALRDGKCMGFILVWGQYFGPQVNPQDKGGDSATAQFVNGFRDSLVLVFVRHETEIAKVPPAVSAGYSGPDEGGYAPSMAVTDPSCSTYICEVPCAGPDADGAKRLAVFRVRIDRIKAWLAAHPAATAAALPLVAPNGPADATSAAVPTGEQPAAAAAADPSVVAHPPPAPAAVAPSAEPAVAPVPAATTAATAPAAATPSPPSPPSPSATPATAATPTASGTPASPASPTAPTAALPLPPPAPITYQQVTLTDGRVLDGHLAADKTSITLISLTSGKAISALPLGPDLISTVLTKQFTPAADSVATLTPAQRAVKAAERSVVYDIYQLNTAKQLNADTIQEDITWDRTTAHIVPTSQSQSDMLHARLDNLHHRLATTAAAIPVAKAQVDKAISAYKALGGTRDFTPLFKEPPKPH